MPKSCQSLTPCRFTTQALNCTPRIAYSSITAQPQIGMNSKRRTGSTPHPRTGPELDDWPRAWQVEPADIVVGQQIVQVLTPFLLHLSNQGLTKTTLRRHRNNLRSLGSELIRRRQSDDELARLDIKDALRQLIEGTGGPLMWPRISESEQDSLDATCRKLDRFMCDSALAHSPA